MTFVYGICVSSWDKVAKYAPADREVMGLSNQPSIAIAYNRIIDAMMYRPHLEGLVLIHDDLEIVDVTQFEGRMRTALYNGADLVGVIGGSGAQGLAWWDGNDLVGQQETDSGLIKFSRTQGEVECLDGTVLVLSPWAVRNVGFDERFEGWHAYACDLCATVRSCGRKILVAPAYTHHHSTVGWKSDEIREQHEELDQQFREKWGRRPAA